MKISLSDTQSSLEWLKHKLALNEKSPNAKNRFVKRGQVYLCNLGVGVGSELRKMRPCIIYQNDRANKSSSNVTVIPITHREHKLHVPITVQSDPISGAIILDGYATCSSIRTVDKVRLGDFITALSEEEMKSIDIALAKNVDIFKHYESIKNLYEDKLLHVEKLEKKIRELEEKLSQFEHIN